MWDLYVQLYTHEEWAEKMKDNKLRGNRDMPEGDMYSTERYLLFGDITRCKLCALFDDDWVCYWIPEWCE